MAKKVEKWESDRGLFFDTEEEALESDRRDNFGEGMEAIHSNKVEGQKRTLGVGGTLALVNMIEFVWKYEDLIQKLFNGETLELKPEEEKKTK